MQNRTTPQKGVGTSLQVVNIPATAGALICLSSPLELAILAAPQRPFRRSGMNFKAVLGAPLQKIRVVPACSRRQSQR